MSNFSCILMGSESLLIQCGDMLRARGHDIRAVATGNPEILAWADTHGFRTFAFGDDLTERLSSLPFEWLFSVANLNPIPASALDLAASGAINFHDGPLPRYAGLNAPVWALLNGETRYGITWHMIDPAVDAGDIVEQRMFDIAADETAMTLNAKCYGAAIEGFAAVVAAIESGTLRRAPQDAKLRTWFKRHARPRAAARLDFARPAGELAALVRALDHGTYRNPLACPKIVARGHVLLVRSASEIASEGTRPPGTVLAVDAEGLTVGTGAGALRLAGLTDTTGTPVCPISVADKGDMLPSLSPEADAALTAQIARLSPGEDHWARALRRMAPADLPMVNDAAPAPLLRERRLSLPADLSTGRLIAALGALTARLAGQDAVDLAFCDTAIATAAETFPGHVCPWVPLRFEGRGADRGGFADAAAALAERLAWAARHPGFAADLLARDPGIKLRRAPHVGVSTAAAPGLIDGTVLTVAVGDGHARLICDTARLAETEMEAFAARLEHLAAAVADGRADALALARSPILPEAERAKLLQEWNATEADYDRGKCLHMAFEAQVARTPDASALIFRNERLSYAELNARANRIAHVLRDMGVGPDVPVGLYTTRSPDMLAGALGILKAGGAYVPLDPAYPAERIAHYSADSAAPVIVTQSALQERLPDHKARLLLLDRDDALGAAPDANPESGVGPDNLAYLIYTSGSTGAPKGVMVEHRNVANFFAGMDDQIRHDPPGVWLAVTSLSFDISVLELFWTLARGFRLVLTSDEDRTLIAGGSVQVTDRSMDFSLYYWGNDDGAGPKKYEMLLEGAKFADSHGFRAIWTPERHFHAFGGPYPNPSVTGAAVAAVTRNIDVRAGSCVAPLHHPARIAEEWAVIDNLTNGRAGLAIASGWQPDDFVLRPENTPPANRQAMLDSIDTLRRLWRGEAVEFPKADGTLHAVITQPRPVSRELPVWVTTAGNPATWKEAGALGANVLTHLLGQSIDEVGEKIALYHAALREAGHDPANHTVTLMLHSYVARDRAQAREVARGPMKDYLRSAAGLIKQYAWAFPAFKRPQGVENPMQIDLSTLSEDEMEGVLDFAFQRYFEESGLFGTVDDCLARVEQLKRIGVDEVACLIDYGIATEKVMESLYPLAEVLRRANAPTGLAEDDYSIAAQIVRHGVTHLQCTPSMARMLTMNEDARAALSGVPHLMIGGEALSGALAADLARITGAPVRNMYGPTETTIWSATETASEDAPTVNIGRPIANTQLHVLDEARELLPVGVAGELWIAGDGVARGYWRRDDLTAERFLPDPFRGAGRMYRTGDLVRRRWDGKIDFLGRADAQVKIRGHRIEPGEIEARLEALAEVAQAVVIAREDTPGDVRLVAYLKPAGALSEQTLREHLAAALPDHMVPSHFVTLDSFPLTPNRKIDRKALPAPDRSGEGASKDAQDFVAPGSDVERTIATIWARVLGVRKIGAQDNFFALGGHSLLAVQAHRELSQALAWAKPGITDIFRFPTLSALAAHLGGVGTPAPDGGALPGAATTERAEARTEAMARRRELRARREARS